MNTFESLFVYNFTWVDGFDRKNASMMMEIKQPNVESRVSVESNKSPQHIHLFYVSPHIMYAETFSKERT